MGRRISLKFSLYVEKLADKPKRHNKWSLAGLWTAFSRGDRVHFADGYVPNERQGSFIDAISNPYIGAHEKGCRFSNRETESFPFI